jgi:hypothetical protein
MNAFYFKFVLNDGLDVNRQQRRNGNGKIYVKGKVLKSTNAVEF